MLALFQLASAYEDVELKTEEGAGGAAGAHTAAVRAAVVGVHTGRGLGEATRERTTAQLDLSVRVTDGKIVNIWADVGFGRSRVRVVAGVRFEGTNLDTLSFDSQTNSLSDKASGSYLKILPSASLRYAFTGNTDLRLVYGRGLARPDPQDIAQAVTFTSTGNPGSIKNTASLGNPNLKAETANTYTAGLVLQPRWIPGLAFTVDYFNIKVKGLVGTYGFTNVLNQCATTGDPTFCSLINRDQFGSLTLTAAGFVTLTNVNTGGLKTRATRRRRPAACPGVPTTQDSCVAPPILGTSAQPTTADASRFVLVSPKTKRTSTVTTIRTARMGRPQPRAASKGRSATSTSIRTSGRRPG